MHASRQLISNTYFFFFLLFCYDGCYSLPSTFQIPLEYRIICTCFSIDTFFNFVVANFILCTLNLRQRNAAQPFWIFSLIKDHWSLVIDVWHMHTLWWWFFSVYVFSHGSFFFCSVLIFFQKYFPNWISNWKLRFSEISEKKVTWHWI